MQRADAGHETRSTTVNVHTKDFFADHQELLKVLSSSSVVFLYKEHVHCSSKTNEGS